MNKKYFEYSGYTIHILTFIAYFILLFIIDVPPSLKFLSNYGFIFFGLGLLFVLLSLASQRQKEQGKIIDTGVYGIVRNPMYLGGMMLFIAMALFLPNWIMIGLSVINQAIIYAFTVSEERVNIVIFGDSYREYMARVPRLNPIIGLIRVLKRERSNN